jgi:thiosulfate/3-mercaptopyruvate sulfurtransferase
MSRLPASGAWGWLLLPAFIQPALVGCQPKGQSDSSLSAPKEVSLLIEPAELQKRLQRKRLRIVDTRSQEQYAEGHIPGAVLVDVQGWKELGRSKGGFQNVKAWSDLVGEFGIEPDSQVVVYGSRLSNTARIWWMLKYLGLKDVMILNGGWNLWANENRPTSAAMPSIIATDFTAKFQADRLEEMDTLEESLRTGNVTVVDARSDDEFTGKEVRGKRGGHIPGAVHLEWNELVAEDGRFKTTEQLNELFLKRGILPDETAVCY